MRRYLARAVVGAACLGLWLPTQAGAADKVRISALSDVTFGTIANFASDSFRSQSVCVYSKSPPLDRYRITASGSGPAGSFRLTSGSDSLPYEVQWRDVSGQATGTPLVAGQPLTAQQNSATVDDCSKGPATTGSVIVILRAAAVGSVTSGTYTGTLSLLVAPE